MVEASYHTFEWEATDKPGKQHEMICKKWITVEDSSMNSFLAY